MPPEVHPYLRLICNTLSTIASFSKFVRPDTPVRGIITDRDLDIIEVILRYRFSPASELVRLAGGNFKVTLRRLRMLWEWGYINRFAFPGIRSHSEFIYYLDTMASLELLMSHGRQSVIHPQIKEEVRLNRESDYAGAVMRGEHMKLGFLQHSLMISRMHFMLEMSSRDADANLSVEAWRQGPELRGHKVVVPEIASQRLSGTNEYLWQEHDVGTTKLPVEPDALFTLKFSDGRSSHFCYEADRSSMPLADMLRKLRAYYHFIKRQQKHREVFAVHPIRAVLIETTDESRARKLMRIAEEPAVIGSARRAALFWFVISPVFGRTYLSLPEIVLAKHWALPDLSLHSLVDMEN